MQTFLFTSTQFITYPVQTSDSSLFSLFSRFLTPYNPSTYSPSIAFLFRTNVRLTPLQPLSYPFNDSHSIAFLSTCHPPTYSPSITLLSTHKRPTYSPSIPFLPLYHPPTYSHFYPLTISQLTPVQSHFYPLTIPQLTPLQSLSYSLTIVRLTPYNRLTYPPSNALLIPYKPWPYSRSIDCLSRNNVRLIPLQFHTKVQIYPH